MGPDLNWGDIRRECLKMEEAGLLEVRSTQIYPTAEGEKAIRQLTGRPIPEPPFRS